MSRVAVIICNYNKQDYVLNCIGSVLNSTYKDLDIYVVDNASVDDSVQLINNKYYNDVTLIVNEENKGGSGGFNTGIREALKENYEYLMLLDNDVVVEENAIKVCLEYLDENKDVAIAGSKIYSMDSPNQIQEFGARLDFENCSINTLYRGFIDDSNIPNVIECQYVAACSMMVRVSSIKQVGLMSEENFIYWDDIDWGYRFILSGFKIVALSKSHVWHKMGSSQKTNTFGTYYFWRNRIRFFVKYCSKKDLDELMLKLFHQIFQAIYMCNFLGKYNTAKAIFYAVEDSLNNITGKSKEDRIMTLEPQEDRLIKILQNKKKMLIVNDGNISILRKLINKIVKYDLNISIYDKNIDTKNQLENIVFIHNKEDIEYLNYDVVCKTCHHILDIKDTIIKDRNIDFYIDRFENIACGEEHINYISSYNTCYNLAKNIWYPMILNKAYCLRDDLN